MGPLESIALVAIVVGLLVSAPRFLGVDPIGQTFGWLRVGNGGARGDGDRIAEPIEIALDQIGRDVKDLGEHIEAVRHLAEERGAEVERFREGYNFSVTRSLARGVIKTVDMVADFRRQLEETHGPDASDADCRLLNDALARLEATSAQLEMLLEANQIEAFWPEIGVSIEDDSQRFEPIEVRPTTDPGEHGCVAEVKYPGWMLVRGDADHRVIREAQVSVLGPVKEGADS